jgi:hypothetical protein
MSPDDHATTNEEPRPHAPESGHIHFSAAHWFSNYDSQADIEARLEWLDDLMFAAIDGDPVALEAAADAWHKSVDELGAQTVEESRLQYLRHAQSVWNSLRHQPNHPPHKVFAAIEVISLLAERAW